MFEDPFAERGSTLSTNVGVAAKTEAKGLSISLDSVVYINAAAGINGDGAIDSAGNGGILGKHPFGDRAIRY